jgi:hypothetical protein
VTRLLQAALKGIAELSETEQDAIAALILEELGDEVRWQKAFADSTDNLTRLAHEALNEFRSGETQPLDLDGP